MRAVIYFDVYWTGDESSEGWQLETTIEFVPPKGMCISTDPFFFDGHEEFDRADPISDLMVESISWEFAKDKDDSGLLLIFCHGLVFPSDDDKDRRRRWLHAQGCST